MTEVNKTKKENPSQQRVLNLWGLLQLFGRLSPLAYPSLFYKCLNLGLVQPAGEGMSEKPGVGLGFKYCRLPCCVARGPPPQAPI